MFKVASVCAIALAAASAASAQSADNAWAGPYVGVHAGWGFDDGRKLDIGGTTAATNNAVGSGARPIQLNQNRGGFVGGGQVGFNLQRGRWVFGPEGDFSYMHSRGTAGVFTLNAAGQPQGTIVRNRMDWMGSARLRGGYAISENGIIYATGGYAFGKVRGSAAFNSTTGGPAYTGRSSYTADGWTAGAGAEFRPWTEGRMSKVSLGVESTYYDLGRSHIFAGATTAANTGAYIVGKNMRGFNGVVKLNYGF
jgi:outer membrane immunogenic protein